MATTMEQRAKFRELRLSGIPREQAMTQAYGDIPTTPTPTGGATLPITPTVTPEPTPAPTPEPVTPPPTPVPPTPVVAPIEEPLPPAPTSMPKQVKQTEQPIDFNQ